MAGKAGMGAVAAAAARVREPLAKVGGVGTAGEALQGQAASGVGMEEAEAVGDVAAAVGAAAMAAAEAAAVVAAVAAAAAAVAAAEAAAGGQAKVTAVEWGMAADDGPQAAPRG